MSAELPINTVKITVFKNTRETIRIIVHELCGIIFSVNMLDSLKGMFGFARMVNYKKLVAGGAFLIDVRTKNEFANGHISGSINIPLNELKEGMNAIGKSSTVILCCASGLRSASARNVLLSMGYCNVYNGGSFNKLQKQLK